MKNKNWKIKLGILSFSENLEKIIDGEFSHFRLMEVTIPKNIKSIGNYAFIGNDMVKLNISDGVNTIGDNAFSYNYLSYIKIPSSVIKIGNYSFSNNRLSKVILSEGLEKIGDYAFSNNKIKSIVIPRSVKSIGKNAFDEMDVTYKDTLVPKKLIKKYGTENIIKIANLLDYININELYLLPYEVLSIMPSDKDNIKEYFNNKDLYNDIREYAFKNNRKIKDDNLFKLCYILGLFKFSNKEVIINFINSFSDEKINSSMKKVYITNYKNDAKELILNLFLQDKLIYNDELITDVIYNGYESIKSNYVLDGCDAIFNYIDDNNLDKLRKDSSYNVNLSKKIKKK